MAGEFDLSARITADASGLVQAATQATGAYEGIEKAQRGATTAARDLEAATSTGTDAQTAGATKAAAATESLGDAIKRAAVESGGAAAASLRVADAASKVDVAESRAAAAVARLELAHLKAAKASDMDAAAQLRITQSLATAEANVLSTELALGKAKNDLGVAQGRTSQAQQAGVGSSRQLEFAYKDLGYQIQDIGAQLSTVSGPSGLFRIFAQQGGQIFSALGDIASAGKGAGAGIKETGAGAEEANTDLGALGEGAVGVAEKVEHSGGKFAAVAGFLAGPWGAAILLAVSALGPMILKLFEADKAAEEFRKSLDAGSEAADTFANAQGLISRAVDTSTGKLKTHNLTLINYIKLQAEANIVAAQAAQREQRATLVGLGRADRGESFGVAISGYQAPNRESVGATVAAANQRTQAAADLSRKLAPLQQTVTEFANVASNPNATAAQLDRAQTTTLNNIDLLARTNRLAGRDVLAVKKAVLDLAITRNDQASNQAILDGFRTGDFSAFVDPKKAKKPKKESSALDDFGRSAATTIANIVGQFDDAPPVIDKTNAKIRELDDLIAKLGERHPPGFEALIASAEAAKIVVRDGLIKEVARAFEAPKTLADKGAEAIRQLDAVIADLAKNKPPGFEKLIADARTAEGVIRDSLQKPYRDFIKAQQESLAVQRLALTGHIDEANALKEINALEKDGPRLTVEQKDAILATVQAMRAEQVELDRLRELGVKFTEALGGIKTVVEDATQAFVRGDLGQLLKSPGKLLNVFQTLQGRKIFDSLFGGLFTEIQGQLDGTSPVKAAGQRMASAVDAAAASIATTQGSTDRLTPSLDTATAAVNSFGAALDRAAGRVSAGPSVGPIGSLAGSGIGGPDDDAPLPGEFVVTGRSPNALPSADLSIRALPAVIGDLHDLLKGQLPQQPELFATALGGVATKLVGIFTNPTSAANIGASIGRYASKGLAGAATGQAIAGIGNALGIKLNSTGSSIGGAIGGALPIPGGSIIGSVLGGLVGGLFSKPKYGTASINSTGSATTVGAGGNSDAAKTGANTLAGSVQQGVAQIAQQLGGSLGSYAVSIGTFDGKYRVSTTGFGGSLDSKKAKGQGLVDFGKDGEAAAIAFAIQDAIKDGAVQGLSAAVQSALASSADVDKALKEALGVQALERTLGGLGSQLKAIFDAEDAAGKERVRLAQTYGLDLAATEKLNDENRAKLVDDTLKSRIGSLSDFLQSVKFGDLFEGTAAERRDALVKQIATVQADAEAGKDGAADQLAQLSQQLIATDRDAYGTAGSEYTTDRTNAISGVERVIQMETDRVNQAAGLAQATTDAIIAGNDLTGESNDLLAQLVTATRAQTAALAASLGTSPSGVDYGSTFREANLILA